MTTLRRSTLAVALAALLLGATVGTAGAEDGVVTDGSEDGVEDVLYLRDMGIGWGDIVKITAYADALGMSAEEYLETVPLVDGDFDFGDVDAELRRAVLRDARNFGELVHDIKALAANAEDSLEGEDDEEATELEDEIDLDDLTDDETLEEMTDEMRKAELLAEAFGVEPDAVLELRASTGWGAVFKLLALSAAMGVEPADLVPAEGGGWSFGQLKKSLTPEQAALLAAAPRNLGQVMSGHWTPDSATDEATALRGNGKAKPKKNKAKHNR